MTIKRLIALVAHLILPEKVYLRVSYWHYYKEKLILDKPTSFTQKLWWLKRYYKYECPELMKLCYDKYRVRKYVAEKIGLKYLNELIGVYAEADEIKLECLPSQFVLKVTQSCGMNFICFDKNQANEEALRALFRKWLKQAKWLPIKAAEEGYLSNGKPTIICEKLLIDSNGEIPDDYKIYCFNGIAELIRVCVEAVDSQGKRKKQFVMNTYDRNWNIMDMNCGDVHYTDKSIQVEKPKNLDEMIRIAEKLSEDFPFVRVDLYNYDGKIFFGELTWFPGGAARKLSPEKLEVIYGEKLSLPNEE